MDFSKNIVSVLVITVSLSTLIGCSGTYLGPDSKPENLIGVPLMQNTQLQSSNTQETEKILIFDKTTRKVHHFDLSSNTHLKVFDVLYPEEEHYLIYSSSKNYFIDVSRQHIAVQSIDGDAKVSGSSFIGTPLSAAYSESTDTLVFYDSYQTLMIIKLDDKGRAIDSFPTGSVLNLGTIQAGDVSDDGRLILSLRGTPDLETGERIDWILVVNLKETLEKKQLVYEPMNPGLKDISWVAPVSGEPNLVLLKASGKVALYDLGAKTVQTLPSDEWVVEKYSKTKDPHIILRKTYDWNSKSEGNVDRRIIYVESRTLKSKTTTKNSNYILSSHLDLERGLWSVTQSRILTEYSLFNSYNTVLDGRKYTRYRLDDLLALKDHAVDNKATIEISQDFIFSLFPSEMGFATRKKIDSGDTQTIRNFNLKYLK